MTIKDYAASRAVSYETVRRQVAAAKKKALKGHISYQGNAAMLDDFAIEYLDQHRQPRNIVVTASSEETQKELERLQSQINQLQAELLKRTDRINGLLEEKTKLLEEKTLLIEDKTKAEMKAAELESVKQELASYKPSLFGLYKKVNRQQDN